MKSQFVLGGRFRVFEDGSANKVFDGVEAPATLSYAGRRCFSPSPAEARYVECAAKGMSICEVAKKFGVSKQCVGAALLFAEQKAVRGTRLTKGQENKRVSLFLKVNKAKAKLRTAEAACQIAKSDFDAAQNALLLFDQAFIPSEQLPQSTRA